MTQISVEIKDLDSLKKAAEECGLELIEGQKTYKWYGTSVGDYPIPAGFTEDDLGKCDHAIRIPNNNTAYEIGVVRRRDGKDGYTLMYDFWQGGYGIMNKVGGDKCQKLVQEYQVAVAKKNVQHLLAKGYKAQRVQAKNGHVHLKLFR